MAYLSNAISPTSPKNTTTKNHHIKSEITKYTQKTPVTFTKIFDFVPHVNNVTIRSNLENVSHCAPHSAVSKIGSMFCNASALNKAV